MRDRKHCPVLLLVALVTFWFLPGCMLEFSGTIEVDGGVDGGGKPDGGQTCEDECDQGFRVCEGIGFKVCGQYDADQCVEWSPPMECQPGQNCTDGMCGQGCSDLCVAGTRQCVGNRYQVCSDTNSDSCFEWGGLVACEAGLICDQGQCLASCNDECQAGTRQCAGNGSKTCNDHDADGCLEWGGFTACSAGEICNQGYCSSSCSDLCTTGTRRCVGNAYEICGDYNSDGCSEWGGQTPCSSGLICDEGQCSETCVNACQAGEKRCAGAGFYEVCGNYDADSCMDWGGQTACSTGQACSQGECVSNCTDECQAGTRRCSGNGYETCYDHDGDTCLEWGGYAACAAGEICNLGVCEGTCSDECTAGTRSCVGNASEVCGNYDTDNCQEWGDYTACAAGEICNQGYCESNCTDECTAGQQRCVAGVEAYEICGEYDGDSCTEWGGQVNCQADEICDAATATCESQSNEYPPGPYGKSIGSTMANECFEECQCNGSNPSGGRPFCLEEYVGNPAILVTIHAGW